MFLRDILGTQIFLTFVLVLAVTVSCEQKNNPQSEPKVQAQEDVNKVKIAVETVKAAKTLEAAGAEKETAVQRLDYERKLKEILNSIQFVVSIKVEESFLCTGFFVDKRGYVLTSKHCLNNIVSETKMSLIFRNGDEHPLRFVEEIQTLDMVI